MLAMTRIRMARTSPWLTDVAAHGTPCREGILHQGHVRRYRDGVSRRGDG